MDCVSEGDDKKSNSEDLENEAEAEKNLENVDTNKNVEEDNLS